VAELDDIAVTVLPIVEEGEIGANGLDRSQRIALGSRGFAGIIAARRGRGPPSRLERRTRLRAAAPLSEPNAPI